MDQRTFENSDRSNPQTMALQSRLIKMFFWGNEACQGTSNRPKGILHRTNNRERFHFHEGIPYLELIITSR